LSRRVTRRTLTGMAAAPSELGPSTARAALDDARLAHLVDQLGVGGFAQLMTRFGPASATELDRLDRAVATGEVEAIRGAAHRIVGFASNFGARTLADLARTLELEPSLATEMAPRLRNSARSTEVALAEDATRRARGEDAR